MELPEGYEEYCRHVHDRISQDGYTWYETFEEFWHAAQYVPRIRDELLSQFTLACMDL